MPERIESIPENLKKSGKQAKRASKNFAAFDEIMQVGQNAMVGEADAVSKAMAKADKAAKETDKTTESIKDKLIRFLKELGTLSLAGLFLPKTASFLGFLSGLGKTYNAYKDMFTNGIKWPNLTDSLLAFAQTVASAVAFLAAIGWMKDAKGVATLSFILIAAGMCGLYFAFKDAFKNGITWKNLALGLSSFGAVVAGVIVLVKIAKLKNGTASAIGKAGEAAGSAKSPTSAWKILGTGLAVVAPFLLIAAGMCAIYLAFPKVFENGINWSNICQGLLPFAAGVAVALGLGLAATLILKQRHKHKDWLITTSFLSIKKSPGGAERFFLAFYIFYNIFYSFFEFIICIHTFGYFA